MDALSVLKNSPVYEKCAIKIDQNRISTYSNVNQPTVPPSSVAGDHQISDSESERPALSSSAHNSLASKFKDAHLIVI